MNKNRQVSQPGNSKNCCSTGHKTWESSYMAHCKTSFWHNKQIFLEMGVVVCGLWYLKRQLTTVSPLHVSSHLSLLKRLSLNVRVNVVLNRTVVVDSDWRFDKLCGSHLQSQSELCHVSWWYYTLVIDLIGQLRRDVIGRLSVKPWCYEDSSSVIGSFRSVYCNS